MNNNYDYSIHDELQEIQRRINYFKQAMLSTCCPIQKSYYQGLVLKDIDYASRLLSNATSQSRQQPREFTLQELTNYDGTGGKPAYAAVDGIVYDVSLNPAWGGGSHFGLLAGRDLTSQFNGCHGTPAMLSKLPQVGTLKS